MSSAPVGAPASRPAIVAEALTKRFVSARGEVLAVDRVSLEVPRGAFVVLGGPSGGGKTTLLSLLVALERPTSGRVVVDGSDLAAASEAERSRVRRRVGFSFQGAPHVDRLPVWENVTLALVPEGVPARERRRRAAAALERVGVAALLDERPERLSGGERARVALARAIVAAPPILVADEPTANLDPVAASAVRALLEGAAAGGTTVLVATHDPALRARASAAYVMAQGRLGEAAGADRSADGEAGP